MDATNAEPLAIALATAISPTVCNPDLFADATAPRPIAQTKARPRRARNSDGTRKMVKREKQPPRQLRRPKRPPVVNRKKLRPQRPHVSKKKPTPRKRLMKPLPPKRLPRPSARKRLTPLLPQKQLTLRPTLLRKLLLNKKRRRVPKKVISQLKLMQVARKRETRRRARSEHQVAHNNQTEKKLINYDRETHLARASFLLHSHGPRPPFGAASSRRED